MSFLSEMEMFYISSYILNQIVKTSQMLRFGVNWVTFVTRIYVLSVLGSRHCMAWEAVITRPADVLYSLGMSPSNSRILIAILLGDWQNGLLLEIGKFEFEVAFYEIWLYGQCSQGGKSSLALIPQSHQPNWHGIDFKSTKIITFGERLDCNQYWFSFVILWQKHISLYTSGLLSHQAHTQSLIYKLNYS